LSHSRARESLNSASSRCQWQPSSTARHPFPPTGY